jgi:hypothetical protein
MSSKTSCQSAIPADLKTTLEDIEFYAQVDDGQKPCIKTKTYVPAKSWNGVLTRWWSGESWVGISADIDRLAANINKMVSQYRDTDHIDDLVGGMMRLKPCIEKLEITYSHRPQLVAKLRVFSTELGKHIAGNRQEKASLIRREK